MVANAGAVFSGLGQDLVTGTCRSGPFGTPLPPGTTAAFETALDAALKDAGYIGERGVMINTGRSFTDILDMDGNAIDTIQTESNGTIATTFLELTQVTLGNLFGDDNVSVTAATATAGTRHVATVALGEDLEPKSWVFRMKSGKKRAMLIVPKGRITENGEIGFTRSGPASVDVTIKAIPVYDNTAGKNVDFWLILDDGVYAVSLIPTLTSILPSSKGAGDLVTIRGSRFTGTTAVSVNGTPVIAEDWTVVDDGSISLILPAGSAGTVPVVVTNASGPSAARNYTRIA